MIAVVAFSANGFGGGGKNAMAAPRTVESLEADEEPETEALLEGSSFVTEAKIQFGLLNTGSEGQHLAGALLERDVRNRQRRQADAQIEIEALQKQILKEKEEAKKEALDGSKFFMQNYEETNKASKKKKKKKAAAAPAAATAAAVATTAIAVAALAIAPAQHLHFGCFDFKRSTLDAILARVLARADPALNVNRAAFFQVFPGNFRQSAIHHDVVPFRALLAHAVLVFPGIGRGDAEIADSLAVGHVAHFRVPAQITDQNDLVDGCHVSVS